MPTDHPLTAAGKARFELRHGDLLDPRHGLPQVAPVAPQDITFIALLNGFRSHDGLQRLSALQAARRGAWSADVIETLPVRVADRTALGITWDHEAWVRGFQFDRHSPHKWLSFRSAPTCHCF